MDLIGFANGFFARITYVLEIPEQQPVTRRPNIVARMGCGYRGINVKSRRIDQKIEVVSQDNIRNYREICKRPRLRLLGDLCSSMRKLGKRSTVNGRSRMIDWNQV